MIGLLDTYYSQPDHTRVVDFDAGEPDGADGNGQRQPLQQRKIHVHVQPLRLKAGKAVGDGEEPGTRRCEMVEPFLQAKVVFKPKSARLCEQTSLRRKVENFSYCLINAFRQ